MALFRKSEPHMLAVAMSGVKLGDRYLQIGCSDPSMLTAIASKVGISGRACLISTGDEQTAAAKKAAARAGLLIEVEQTALNRFPYDEASFELLVIDSQDGLIANMRPEDRVAVLQQSKRVLTPRGRIVLVEAAPRPGLGALLTRANPKVNPHYLNTGGALEALRAEGFKAVRQLAERDGMSFFEGIA